ncbi:hypothetical protein SERLA73DRAFT_177272 [Serpula lacrymans var. lacrymans S7.3]|uniref:Uncharacterized protein n=2 Tax=Serpula lacrymans var. lacrymans TaxID=341189 RepID=F8PNQ0_SERL3|nr:uncharacterized protein SERLADRAFT_460781 [Serpula lacrymans var. lacrymans S7.9]EGO01777.1 hypothetical protein SERLA73DRAFT_177272 [Serpula lacrymans var. lacrymans S7.3]EGO27411.1 hypothetical protein SERLADRAFT_460781 [Serpula lacrymans var. lacrymans S7.9]
MEIKHLDSQIQIFDRRKGGYDRTPCLAFGYRSSSTKFETSYSKGCTRYNFFLRGFRDGSVILWDYRKAKDVVIKQQYQQAEPVVHTAFSNSDLVAFGDGFVTFSQLDSS